MGCGGVVVVVVLVERNLFLMTDKYLLGKPSRKKSFSFGFFQNGGGGVA